MKLEISEFHVGREKAEKYIFQLLKDLGASTKKKRHIKSITVGKGEDEREIYLKEEIDYVRKNGKASLLQNLLDANDRFLNSPTSLGVLGDDCGIKITTTSTYGNHASSIEFPGVIEAPEISFADDISFFRREAVRAFNAGDLSGFSRSYRGFLQSSVSLIDCFLHRYTFHIKNMIPSTSEYANTKVLDSRKSLEERLEAWVFTFATHKMDEYMKSKYRSKFIELKAQRNNIVHPSSPSIPYGVKNSVKYLNYAQEGVGGLLYELRKYTGFSPNIGFISQVRMQPKVCINKNA